MYISTTLAKGLTTSHLLSQFLLILDEYCVIYKVDNTFTYLVYIY